MNLFSVDLTFSDSLIVFVIGMIIIFLVLAVLVLTVMAYVGVFKLFDRKKSNKKDESVSESAASDQAANQDDAELVAAISAAIAAVYAAEAPDGEIPPFRVKSIISKWSVLRKTIFEGMFIPKISESSLRIRASSFGLILSRFIKDIFTSGLFSS